MTFEDMVAAVRTFRAERDWDQFHNPKDLAISINLESAELLECFQWSGADTYVSNKQESMREELADVMIYCIYMADALGVDLAECVSEKIAQNASKYPAEKSRGCSKKYTEL